MRVFSYAHMTLTLTLILKPDLDITIMYLRTKEMKFVGQLGVQKSEPEQDRQTHRETDATKILPGRTDGW